MNLRTDNALSPQCKCVDWDDVVSFLLNTFTFEYSTGCFAACGNHNMVFVGALAQHPGDRRASI